MTRRNQLVVSCAVVVVLFLVAGLGPAAAAARTKRIGTSVTLDVFGVVDRHGGVTYAFSGGLAAHFTFACEAARQVTLFRVEPDGTAVPVGSTRSEFGLFVGTLERPLNEITGSYYAEAAPVTRKFKRGRYRKLKCLGGRSGTIFVEVPGALLAPP